MSTTCSSTPSPEHNMALTVLHEARTPSHVVTCVDPKFCAQLDPDLMADGSGLMTEKVYFCEFPPLP